MINSKVFDAAFVCVVCTDLLALHVSVVANN